MRSFASIATFATLAFAAVASALPTLTPGTPAAGDVVNNEVLVGVQNTAVEVSKNLNNLNVASPQAQQTTGGSNVARGTIDADNGLNIGQTSDQTHVDPRGAPAQSVVEIIVGVTAEVRPLCDKLTGAITGDIEVEVAVKIALEILGQIKDCLFKAKGEIEAAIHIGVGLLVLNGVTLAVHAVAQILAVLVIVVVTVLGLVFKICLTSKVDALLSLILEIAGILAGIIALVLPICGGLLVELVPLLQCILPILTKLNLVAIVKVLAIAV